MAAKAPGYIYILTDPSFREDWVKGKSSRPVDIRSKEHDDTTVPLLFEVSVILRNCQIRLYLNKALCRVVPHRPIFKFSMVNLGT